MVAPIDAKGEVQADGETFTIRLNWRSIAMLEDHGLDLFSAEGVKMTLARSAVMMRCLAVNDHPDLTDDEALAVIVKSRENFAVAVLDLITRFGGEADEGNGKAAKAAA